MSNIGWVGLGKLGLPCAVALDAAGHSVVGYDVSDAPAEYLRERNVPYREAGLPELLARHGVKTVDTIETVVEHADVVFVAVQTPHERAYDGTVPAPSTTADFEYGYLVSAVRAIADEARRQRKLIELVIVSTVLPGTFDRQLRAVCNEYVVPVYNPFFIAMGTTVADFTHPEFVLLGVDDREALGAVVGVYSALHDAPIRVVSIESAELTKVAYNVSLSAKIAMANYVGEICHKTGADADEVAESLALATDRIVSPRYMRAGMGDGGGCHPRDLIALSNLAERLQLSHDLARSLMDARELHSAWLAELTQHWSQVSRLPIVVLGKAYKPETDLTAGSPAALLVDQLATNGAELVDWWDPHVDDVPPTHYDAAVWFVATAHSLFAEWAYPRGSVVLDPFGIVPRVIDGVTVVPIGRK